MSNSESGCLGCLGSLVVFTAIGSIFLGGGMLIRLSGWYFSIGNPIDRQVVIGSYFNDLEDKQKIVTAAVQKFHTQRDRGKCQETHEQAGEILKRNTSQAQVVETCKEIQRELGAVKSVQQIDWWVQPANQETDRILVQYETQFLKGSGQETFVWLIKDGKAELSLYRLNLLNSGGYDLTGNSL